MAGYGSDAKRVAEAFVAGVNAYVALTERKAYPPRPPVLFADTARAWALRATWLDYRTTTAWSPTAPSTAMLALLFIDLDRFKEVNDTLGHDQGDLLLLEAARRIAASVRALDTVARLAGDEFTVILPAVGDADIAGDIAQAILEQIAAPYRLAGELVVVSASIGVATYPKDADNAEALLASGQFALHYQPIVNLRTGKVCKAEALIRWSHPVRGPIHPVDFIAVAEESGLIIDIGRWVLTEALDQLARWQGLLGKGFQISVNKSPVEFCAPASGPESWSSMIERRNVPVGSLVIEITAGSLMEQNADVMDQLSRFQAAGIEIALDDFGTGYSSLSYRRRLDIDHIKIDSPSSAR